MSVLWLYSAIQLTKSDFLSVFSTLYSIKFPDGKYLEIDQPLALEGLMVDAVSAIRKIPDTEQEIRRFFEHYHNISQAPPQHVYILGTPPMKKVEIDLFEN